MALVKMPSAASLPTIGPAHCPLAKRYPLNTRVIGGVFQAGSRHPIPHTRLGNIDWHALQEGGQHTRGTVVPALIRAH